MWRDIRAIETNLNRVVDAVRQGDWHQAIAVGTDPREDDTIRRPVIPLPSRVTGREHTFGRKMVLPPSSDEESMDEDAPHPTGKPQEKKKAPELTHRKGGRMTVRIEAKYAEVRAFQQHGRRRNANSNTPPHV